MQNECIRDGGCEVDNPMGSSNDQHQPLKESYNYRRICHLLVAQTLELEVVTKKHANMTAEVKVADVMIGNCR